MPDAMPAPSRGPCRPIAKWHWPKAASKAAPPRRWRRCSPPGRPRAVDAAMAAVRPDTITKFLFTSGSTRLPKAVINTHRMWCANQQQMRQSMPAIAAEPPVLVDWLPWNHTFGGNHNVGMVLDNGGTFYIDDGKPTPGGIAETLRNLREIAPTLYFNVPAGFEAIASAMQTDAGLRRPTALARAHVLLRWRRARATGVGQPAPHGRGRDRRAHRDGHRPGHDGVRSVRALRHRPARHVRRHRPADGRHADQAGRDRGQDRGALPRPQRHARLLARP